MHGIHILFFLLIFFLLGWCSILVPCPLSPLFSLTLLSPYQFHTQHHIYDLFSEMLQRVMIHQPEDPAAFLAEQFKYSPNVVRVSFSFLPSLPLSLPLG